MGLFTSQQELELMKKTHESIEASQKNNALLAEVLNHLLAEKQPTEEHCMTEEEKQKAAYALNLCTVSVSQIIDYNDVNFLEREYEAILNNLNLEKMPKDEALLHILKQLLDVITFFRIQEGEKKLLEKEYQQRMKNAIWSAVPNFGVLFAPGSIGMSATGNPIQAAFSTVVSLASAVGIGYMNYRKEKAIIGLEQERKEWELQRSALEQFNGLRRELFDTAWRLAEKYNFNEKYRLTERQITQFNRILMDSDDLRRYERLYYIKDNFDAYPPFWYYLGNAANAVYQNAGARGDVLRDEYKKRAKSAFNHFLNVTENNNLLREDQLEASCALELFDLLDEDERDRKCDLLDRARKASGNAFDVLELCALSYMKIGEIDKAAELLRMLVNEDYNTTVNAQLLSRIYVSGVLDKGVDDDTRTEIRLQYRSLEVRVDSEILVPMPENIEDEWAADDFLKSQKELLREKYASALVEFIHKKAAAYNVLVSSNGDITKDMVALLDQICNSIKIIVSDENIFLLPLQNAIGKHREDFSEMLAHNESGSKRQPDLGFIDITAEAFLKVSKHIHERIDSMNAMYLISVAESELEHFCADSNLWSMGDSQGQLQQIDSTPSIATAIFGDGYKTQQKRFEIIEECLSVVKKTLESKSILLGDPRKSSVRFYIKRSHDFQSYIKRNETALWKCGLNPNTIIAIVNDTGFLDRDLILSTESVVFLDRKRNKGELKYIDVWRNYEQDGLRFVRSKYTNAGIDISVLHELTDALSNIQKKYLETHGTDDIEDITAQVKKVVLGNPSDDKNSQGVLKEKETDSFDVVLVHTNDCCELAEQIGVDMQGRGKQVIVIPEEQDADDNYMHADWRIYVGKGDAAKRLLNRDDCEAILDQYGCTIKRPSNEHYLIVDSELGSNFDTCREEFLEYYLASVVSSHDTAIQIEQAIKEWKDEKQQYDENSAGYKAWVAMLEKIDDAAWAVEGDSVNPIREVLAKAFRIAAVPVAAVTAVPAVASEIGKITVDTISEAISDGKFDRDVVTKAQQEILRIKVNEFIEQIQLGTYSNLNENAP